MELILSTEPGYTLARIVGKLDESADEAFRDRLFPLVGRPKGRLVLDLSRTASITSLGVGLLVRLVAHANTNASRVILADCSSFVAIVLDRCKLGSYLELAPTVPDAAARFGGE